MPSPLANLTKAARKYRDAVFRTVEYRIEHRINHGTVTDVYVINGLADLVNAEAIAAGALHLAAIKLGG